MNTPKPPDGYRWLESGEITQEGDVYVANSVSSRLSKDRIETIVSHPHVLARFDPDVWAETPEPGLTGTGFTTYPKALGDMKFEDVMVKAQYIRMDLAQEPRRVIQLFPASPEIAFAVCNDGTAWRIHRGDQWQQLPPIPTT